MFIHTGSCKTDDHTKRVRLVVPCAAITGYVGSEFVVVAVDDQTRLTLHRKEVCFAPSGASRWKYRIDSHDCVVFVSHKEPVDGMIVDWPALKDIIDSRSDAMETLRRFISQSR